MPMPVSKEIRDKIIRHKQNNIKETEIAKGLLSKQKYSYKGMGAVLEYWLNYAKPSYTRKKIIQAPDTTLLELIDEFNLAISEGAMSKKLKKLGYSYKKTYVPGKKG